MQSRMVIVLSDLEREALQTVSANELRAMRDQVRYIIRRDLQRRGLLPGDHSNDGGIMQIGHVSVSFQRTVSLPGYANFRVGVTLSATVEPEESEELVVNKLYRRAHFLVDHQVRKDEQKYGNPFYEDDELEETS